MYYESVYAIMRSDNTPRDSAVTVSVEIDSMEILIEKEHTQVEATLYFSMIFSGSLSASNYFSVRSQNVEVMYLVPCARKYDVFDKNRKKSFLVAPQKTRVAETTKFFIWPQLRHSRVTGGGLGILV